jgi:serine/threonine protein phosphatase PrpC
MWPLRKSKLQGGGMTITIAAATDTGKVRSHNEDAYKALGGEKSPPGVDAVLLVADGMGGHAAGEVASGMTVTGVTELLASQDQELAQLDGPEYGVFLGEVLQRVNSNVLEAAQDPAKSRMGTTCTLAVIKKGKVFLAHIGDSRAYLFRDGALHQVTTDHSWVEEAVSKGILSKEEARVHPNRNVITRAIGIDPKAEIEKRCITLKDGDLLLVCSDGLTSMVPDEEIGEILKSRGLAHTCKALIDAANSHGGQDNTTVVVAAIGDRKKRPAQTRTRTTGQKTVEIPRRPSFWKALIRKILRRS